MDFSVVVPLYNQEPHIEQCVEALLAQDYPEEDYEIIVVDNNSTDGSVDIVRRYPRVTLLSETTQGDFAARNRGLEAACGEIIAFTDSDTAPEPGWLRAIAAQMSRDTNLGIVVGNLQYGHSRLMRMVADYEAERSEYVLSSDDKDVYFGYTCNMAVRRTVFERLGPFPPLYRNSDVLLVHRLIEHESCRSVAYGKDVRVQRLEVSTLWRYLRKQADYGRDLSRYAHIAGARPLDNRERLEVFRRFARRTDYTTLQTFLLYLVLSAGVLTYDVPRVLFGRRSRAQHSD